jgi:parvulin-like peptidyl-prolyl isomerase
MIQQRLDRTRQTDRRGEGSADLHEETTMVPGASIGSEQSARTDAEKVSGTGDLPPAPEHDDELDLSWGKAVMPDFSDDESSLPTARMDHKKVYAAADAVDSTDATVIAAKRAERGSRRGAATEAKKGPAWLPLAIIAAVIALLAGGWFLLGNTDLFGREAAARVNGESISVQDLDARLEVVAVQNPELFDASLGDAEAMDARSRTLDSMIDDLLLMQKAADEGLSISNAEVQAEIDSRAATFPSQEVFEEELAANGFTVDTFREQTRYAMILVDLLAHLVPEDSISDEEIREYFDLNIDLYREPAAKRSSHILIPLDDRAAATALLEDLNASSDLERDFALAAQEYSIDPSSAEFGGDADWPIFPDQRHPDYIAAVNELEVGELSELNPTELGYFIILVTDERGESTQPFEEVAPGIRDMKLSTLRNQTRIDLTSVLRSEADIEILDPALLEAGFDEGRSEGASPDYADDVITEEE